MKELTKAEDQIMQILWKIKRGFVKDVISEMPDPKPAYNTVSTIIRILESKGFVDHYTYGKTHEYYPVIERDTYRSFYLKNLLRNYFGGKFEHLVSFFARDNDLNVEDMEEILKHVETNLNDPEK
ncbi:MAG: BlaI/MecI/CopY family transcriptional regulator [Cyclobacteriaceae bacterium]|nr:BlaI/MecI/CopY family transcriptional regulator [Cyclobacteriaceae bacterium]